MPLPTRTSHPAGLRAGLTTVAAAATLTAAGQTLSPPGARAETAWLAAVAVLGGGAFAFLPQRPRLPPIALWLGVLGALLVLPGGAGRAIVVAAGLVAVAALALAQLGEGELSWGRLTTAAVASQTLLHSAVWIESELAPGALLAWLAAPIAGALALARGSIGGPHRLWIVAATLLCFTAGWTAYAVLAAAIVAIPGAPAAGSGSTDRRGPIAGGLVAGGVVAAAWTVLDPRAAALVALAAALAVALCLAAPVRRRALWTVAALSFVALLVPGSRSLTECLPVVALAVVALAPAVAAGRHRGAAATGRLVTALLVTAATARHTLELAALAPPVVLMASIATEASEHHATSRAWRVQARWSAVLLAAVALLASYPWLRPEPLASLFGAPRWLVVLAVAVVGASVVADRRQHRPSGPPPVRSTRFAVGLTTAFLVVLLVVGAGRLPQPRRPILVRPVALPIATPRVELELDPAAPGSALVVEAYLSNSVGLAEDAAAVTLQPLAADGSRLGSPIVLRNRREVGEWAAGRPDVRATTGFAAPPAWIHALDREGRFFARHYRASLPLDHTSTAARLAIERAPTLPATVVPTLVAVEVAP